MGFFDKIFGKKQQQESIDQGLQKTREGFLGKISRAIAGKSTVDEEVLDQVEDALVTADIGVETTVKIIDALEARVAKDKYLNTAELNTILKDEIKNLLVPAPQDSSYNNYELPAGHKPHIILVVGVNGVGKTTTIGKLAHNFSLAGKSVLLGAADTFRAAAVDQLKIWADRSEAHFYSKGMNTDPAAVAYETVQYAQNANMDVAIIDTAGRLHTKIQLMDELTKIKRSIDKKYEGAPHEVLLVLDATTGQNAIEQAKHFTAATNVTAIALTKLDGSAKGGVVLGISDQFKIPIKYIGVGEGMEQLQVFNRKAFVDSLFS